MYTQSVAQAAIASENRPCTPNLKVYNSTTSRHHEAALVINRFSRKRNVTGTLVQARHRVVVKQSERIVFVSDGYNNN